MSPAVQIVCLKTYRHSFTDTHYHRHHYHSTPNTHARVRARTHTHKCTCIHVHRGEMGLERKRDYKRSLRCDRCVTTVAINCLPLITVTHFREMFAFLGKDFRTRRTLQHWKLCVFWCSKTVAFTSLWYCVCSCVYWTVQSGAFHQTSLWT